MTKKSEPVEVEADQEEIARRRDETIRRMIATPPKTQKGKPKRAPGGDKK